MKAGVGHASYNTCMILGAHKAQMTEIQENFANVGYNTGTEGA